MAHLACERSEDGWMTALPISLVVRCGRGSAYLSARRTEVDTPTDGPLRMTRTWSRP